MKFRKAGRLFQAALLLGSAFALVACGFHLRENVRLPPEMQRVHLTVNGGGELERHLARTLQVSGVIVEDSSGPGIAEMRIPVAAFSTDSLSAGGYTRITEYAVRYQLQFYVNDASGKTLVPRQRIDMQREYSYDASNTVGSDAQTQEIRRSLREDMIQAILFRLQAAGQQELAVPAAGASAR